MERWPAIGGLGATASGSHPAIERGVRVVPAALGADAGPVGAPALVLADYWNVPGPAPGEGTG